MRQHCFPQSQHCCWIFRATVWIHSLMWTWGIWSIYTYINKSLRFQGSIKHWRAEKRVCMFIILLLLLWLASGHLRLLCDGVCLDAAVMGSERYLCTLEKTQKTNLDPITTCIVFFFQIVPAALWFVFRSELNLPNVSQNDLRWHVH